MKVQELFESVGKSIAESKEDVTKRVMNTLVEREVTARTDAFLTCLGKLEELRRAAKKIKPDMEFFPAEGGGPAAKPVQSYSKAKADELRKNGEEQKKLEDALNKALEDGDFTKVKELAAKGGKAAAEE